MLPLLHRIINFTIYSINSVPDLLTSFVRVLLSVLLISTFFIAFLFPADSRFLKTFFSLISTSVLITTLLQLTRRNMVMMKRRRKALSVATKRRILTIRVKTVHYQPLTLSYTWEGWFIDPTYFYKLMSEIASSGMLLLGTVVGERERERERKGRERERGRGVASDARLQINKENRVIKTD